MINLATKEVINYLLVNAQFNNKGSFRESSKDEPIYILVDYFDWLEYMYSQREHKFDIIIGEDFYASIYHDNRKLINILKRPLTGDSITKILETLNRDEVYSLLVGYHYFSRDMEKLQEFYIRNYVYNNNNLPKLMIPFSFGLNRLATKHYIFEYKTLANEDHLFSLVETKEGVIEDGLQRIKFDILGEANLCKIVTYSYDNQYREGNVILPENWIISRDKPVYTTTSKVILDKHEFINTSYGNYKFSGLIDKFPHEPNFQYTLLLNYPFNIDGVFEKGYLKTQNTAIFSLKNNLGTYPVDLDRPPF